MNKSYRSFKNNNAGKNMELMIEAACTHYERKGLAKIVKVPEPFKVLKLFPPNFKSFNGIFTKRAEPDFLGALKGGKTVVFESKYTVKDRISQSVISDQQRESLELYYQVGAIAGVVVGIDKVYAFVPWEVWREMKERYGRKYMNREDLKEFEVPTPGYIDFLKGVTE